MSKANKENIYAPGVPIDVIGRSCRLPGANNVNEFWDLLASSRCSVSEIGPERFSMFRYKSPRRGERGKSYSFAAGVLDDIWGFDPAVFAISPREAAQMDPQQRLLLMLVWEALEDAGLPPSSLGGREVGVYVGNSGIDHNNRFFFDPAGSDSYMMTGNTGALISNRISYIFDLHGPSMTIDTACSSSLVALDEAVNALRAGHIDTAIVAGVNLLLSPYPFIGFSAASMLSPQGLCRPFDNEAHGYVRAEGGVVLVLQRGDDADSRDDKCHARIVETGANSDGRTVGVALPSADYQARLLEVVYGRAGIDPGELAFVEAHGTGTLVGDPAEAFALGRVLGQSRSKPLLIGSVKSNIGHLEPASGIASLLKAMLALEKDYLPASLHFNAPNPDIPFDELNIEIAGKGRALEKTNGELFAGISNFGFGGTNVHVVIAKPPVQGVAANSFKDGNGGIMMLSAQCNQALREIAGSYAKIIESRADDDVSELAAASLEFRQGMEKRLVVTGKTAAQISKNLADFNKGNDVKGVVTGTAVARDLDVAFVYSGNGSQWPGMGRVAYDENAAFRAQFDRVDAYFQKMAGWSIRQIMHSDDAAAQMQRVEVAQQLLFAVQCGLTAALQDMGLSPAFTIGHSAGEIAAAQASGAITLEQAAWIIHIRSLHQERVRGLGAMAALLAPEEKVAQALREAGLDDIQIAAVNSPRSVTISGSNEGIEAFLKLAKKRRWACKTFNLDYPFHNSLLDPVRDNFLRDLADFKPADAQIQYVSSVTGDARAGSGLDAGYWWRNVREPVRFLDAVTAAANLGARVFLEISPRPVLTGFLNDILGDMDILAPVLTSLNTKDEPGVDPVELTFGRCIASGGRVDHEKVFGKNPSKLIDLPLYPWQNKPFRASPAEGAIEAFILSVPPHPLLGQQIRKGDFIWDIHLDTQLLPFLNDHKVDGKVIMPGAGFAEMFLEAARQWLGAERVELRDMDIVQPLVLGDDYMVEIRTRLSVESSTVEISSRKRFSGDEWQVHAKCRIGKIPGDEIPEALSPKLCPADDPESIFRLYNLSKRHGLEFGPRFRRMIRCDEVEENIIEVVLDERDSTLDPSDGESCGYNIHPLDLDGCFHGLNVLYGKLDLGNDKLAFVPVRLGTLRVYRPGVAVRMARLVILRANRRGGHGDFKLFGADGELVAVVHDARFRATALVQRHTLERTSYSLTHELTPLPRESGETGAPPLDKALALAEKTTGGDGLKLEEQRLLLDAAARRSAYDILVSLGDDQGGVNMAALAGAQDPVSREDRQEAINRRMAIVSNLLAIAEQSGLVEPDGENWQLSPNCPLPAATGLMAGLLAEEPRWLADCVLLNRAASLLPDVLAGNEENDAGNGQVRDIYSPAMLEQLTTSSPMAEAHIKRVADIAGRIIANWPRGRPLRVLELGVGGGGLTRKLHPVVAAKNGILVAADTSRHNISRLKMTFGESAFFDAVALDDDMQGLDGKGAFDLLVSANGLHLLSHADQVVANIARTLANTALAVISASEPDAFHDFVFGITDGWFDWSVDPLFPLNPMRRPDEWAAFLNTCGFDRTQTAPLTRAADSAGVILSSRMAGERSAPSCSDDPQKDEPGKPEREAERKVLLVTGDAQAEAAFAGDLSRELAACGICDEAVMPLCPAESDEAPGAWPQLLQATKGGNGQVADIVYLTGAFEGSAAPMTALAGRLKKLTRLLQALSARKARLWILAPGGARAAIGAGAPSPVQSGIWAFARTATNEYGDLDIRLVDFARELDSAACARRLAVLLSDPGAETELVLTGAGMQVLRAKKGLPGLPPGAAGPEETEAVVLTHVTSGSLDQMEWTPAKRVAPGPGEVQIKVAATGLNFRDVMWVQGLLPEEALEGGFAGPTLGFECSGRISAVGKGVEGLEVGDAVMALAPSCFASHVTVSDTAVSRLPGTVDLIAAAALPVAFLTAYYALHHLARLEEDEWVLIHGAAGGVGLAALQVAKWRKAKVIATAGSDEKRAFLKMLGADHVLDTRSLDFVDQVRAITADKGGEGVNVVLNSLSGEAMERSIELVRPFGRFLELGKRDFYGNTKIGLRPFRRNLSYFGIDADQLLGQQPELSKRLFAGLTQMFDAGAFKPLPYRLYESSGVVEAFRLMQQSGHIGKILVRAPDAQPVDHEVCDSEFEADGDGVHVIIGGLGGFGLEAALWLADHGARSIVLTSRSGNLNAQAQDAVARLEKAGVKVDVARCDVTDETALAQLLARLRQERPIRGVMHAAMVLEDELIQNLTGEQIENVLHPKVQGAGNLDQLTRADQLDYFVLFSSAAALFGNPGQAHYVAANAYLEGLARQRRLEGLPALAVGWGAITDVGILARQKDTAKSLARHTGGAEFRARQALDLLGQLLASDNGAPERSVVTLAAMNWAFAGDALPIMKKPVFTLMAREAATGGGGARTIDILALIEGLGDTEARDKIAHLLAEEVSAIIRMPAGEINCKRSLTDIGMDSLMGMELAAAAQQKLGISIPMVSIADGTTINDIAAKVLTRVRDSSGSGLDGADEVLVQQHMQGDVDEELLKDLSKKVSKKRDRSDEPE